ncbi:MAG: FMN-binding protein [Pseudoflavonifractor sp.]|nr:FMN-binding protein [Pseudoflavonifractor sp.]
MREWIKPLAALAIVAATLTGARLGLAGIARANAEAEQTAMMAALLPGSTSFTPEEYDGEDENITAIYAGDTGYVVETVTDGYVGKIRLLVGVDTSGAVTGAVVRELSETFGLGARATSDTHFLAQFLGTAGDAAVGENVDALTGATVTSKAITKGINSAAAFVTGADVSSGATEWGDW